MDSMNDQNRIQTAMIGCGAMARGHLSAMLDQQDTTNVLVVCEPAPAAYQAVCEMFQARGQTPPPNEPDLDQLLQRYGPELDAAVIVTPHVYHHVQTNACLDAGLDVLLEKPMVINAEQAKDLSQDVRSDRKASGRGFSRQPVTADPHGRCHAAQQ